MISAHSSRIIGKKRSAVIVVKVILKGTPSLLKVNIMSFGFVVITTKLPAENIITNLRATIRPNKNPCRLAMIPRPLVAQRIKGPIRGREFAASGVTTHKPYGKTDSPYKRNR